MVALPRLPLCCVVLAALAASGRPQTSVLYTFDVRGDGGRFGWSVDIAGDVDGDGFDDVIAGDPLSSANGLSSGSARIYSGATGALLYTFLGPEAGEELGTSVSAAGDVDADGFDDVIVGSPRAAAGGTLRGAARVFSGFDGSTLHTFTGGDFDRLGTSVSGAGDVDADGFDDLVVGAPLDSTSATGSGSAYVFSGFDGALLHQFTGDSHSDHFGGSVSGAGDVNADGFDDVIVGAVDDVPVNGGSARVLSGFDGTVLYSFFGDSQDDDFGNSVSDAGDVDGDGYDDVIVGAWKDDAGGGSSGSVFVYSGFDGSTLHALAGDQPGALFGTSVGAAGDVNADGFDDLVVGSYSYDATPVICCHGEARVISGSDGSVLFQFFGDSWGDRFGVSVAGGGDVNNDGVPDFVAGAFAGGLGGWSTGMARVFSGAPLPYPVFCASNANSTGFAAEMSAAGSPSVAANELVLSARRLPPGQPGLFFYGADVAQVPFGDGFRCVGGPGSRLLPPTFSDASGRSSVALDLSAQPAIQPGTTWRFQHLYRDTAGGAAGFNLTDGLSVTFLF